MASALVRQWHLLSLLPRGPRRIDSRSLEDALRARGLAVHRRTIQRDLVELSGVFPLVADERSKPYAWGWADDVELRCAIPVLPLERHTALEMELRLLVRKAAVPAVSEGLRGPAGRANDVLVTPHDEARLELRARVPDEPSLGRWLLGFADAVEVKEPGHLRAELAEKARRVASIYEDRQ